jgi:asparagine synthase (glutamine-hydrolysing)
MCGIAGIISRDAANVSRQRLQTMTDTIIHRGPEGEGFWMNDKSNVGFGHRRLAIIDLSELGAQPMHYLGRYTITYNGEIYNYVELKHTLAADGYTFHSSCDTEVILAAYAAYGKDCVQYFDGMFAFAIWDEQEQTLFCARDRFGEKPLYFYHDAGQFIFASEMKALWAAGVEKKINNTMLLNYLTIGSTNDAAVPSATFYSNIFKLPAAHCLTLQLPAQDVQLTYTYWQYWDIDKEHEQKETSLPQLMEKFNQLFTISVQRRLRSDVAIGSSLSGGLDSSSIVATINNLITDSTKQKTFSAVFPGYEKDESRYIQRVAKAFEVESFTVTPTASGFVNDLEKLIHHQEEPFQSSSIYAQYAGYALAKQHGVTVILDGQGADEILAGYNKYYHWYWQQLIATGNWKQAKHEMHAAKQNGVAAEWGFKNILAAYLPSIAAKQLQKKAHQQQIHHPHITNEFVHANSDTHLVHKPVVDKLNDILYFNTMQSGLEELLRYADRNSMAHSREVRLPFLSHELVQFIFTVPAHFKIKDGFTKYLLRTSMSGMLPKEIVWRKDKIGYEPPQQQWMQHTSVVEQIHAARNTLVQHGILQRSVLNSAVTAQAAHDAGNYDWRYLCAAASLF